MRFLSVMVGCAACLLMLGAPTAMAADTVRLVVSFDDDSRSDERIGELRQAGLARRDAHRALTPAQSIPQLDVSIVEVPAADAAAAIRQLRRSEKVESVEIDHVARISWTPDDPRKNSQWALGKVQAFSAWNIATGEDTLIAVVDTGVDYNHEDLAGKVQLGSDFVDGDPDPYDENGHGTHVAGIAAAITDNGVGMAGIAPDAEIFAVRVLDADGSGFYSWIADGVVEAADAGADVINLSLGGGSPSDTLREAVYYAQLKGAVVTCATGNDGANSIGYPARYSACYSVSSMTSTGSISGFSNTGTGIDITAPGSAILSAVPGDAYESWSGTSMATPVVSGVAALLASQGLTGKQIESVLGSTAIDRGASGYDVKWGHGTVDALNAVQLGTAMPVNNPPAELIAPWISSVTFGTRSFTKIKTTKRVWKLKKKTRWKKIATWKRGMRKRWTKTRVRGNTRTVKRFRKRGRKLQRQVRTFKRVRKVVYKNKAYRTLKANAQDAGGLQSAGFEVDGKWLATDFTPGNGFTYRWACKGGWHTLKVHVVDKAGNYSTKSSSDFVTC